MLKSVIIAKDHGLSSLSAFYLDNDDTIRVCEAEFDPDDEQAIVGATVKIIECIKKKMPRSKISFLTTPESRRKLKIIE